MSKSYRASRRSVLAGAAAAAAGFAAPAIAQSRPRVVVVGGGPGGARAANILARSEAVDVAMVNAQPIHTTGSLSNFYLAGLRSLRSLTHNLQDFAGRRGFSLTIDRVVSVDAEARALGLASGASLAYDRLILAPGISFQQNAIDGYDAVASQAMPHAYAGGFQSYLLKRRLESMPPNSVFAIAAPPDPARCAPAPYERASFAAIVLRDLNPTVRVTIFDAKDDFPHRERYAAHWEEQFEDMISWRPASFTGGGVVGVNTEEMTIRLGSGESIPVGAASISPPHQAAGVAFIAGVVDNGGWAPVSPETMRSTINPEIYVVGDCARLDPMPKTASSALSQAARAAAALLAEFDASSSSPPLEEELWSFADELTSFRSGASYQATPDGLRITSRVETAIPPDERSRLDQSLRLSSWYDEMIALAYG